MKILHLITGLTIGGTELFLVRNLPRLKNYEHIVVSLTDKKTLGIELEKNNIRVYELHSGKWFSPISIIRFKKIIFTEKPDVLITYLIHAAIFGRIFGKMFGIPKIICMIRSQLRKKRHVIYFWIERVTQSLVDYFVSNSISLKNFYKEKLGISEKKIRVIYSPIDADNNSPPTQFNKEDCFIIGTVGRLAKEKRQQDIIQAIKLLKDDGYKVKLIIIGDGPEKKYLQKLIKKLGVGNEVKLAGEQNNIYSWIKIFDIFVLASDYEGMSNALLEAMSVGLPVIVTEIPENKEVVINNETGLLVPIHQPEIIAEKIKIVTKDFDLRDKLRKNSKNFIADNFSLASFLEKISQIIELNN